MIKLYLDTTTAKKTQVEIVKDDRKLIVLIGEEPLLAIKKSLTELRLDLQDIDQFSANPGPGSYTGVRIGAAVANTLNLALGRSAEKIEPIYE